MRFISVFILALSLTACAAGTGEEDIETSDQPVELSVEEIRQASLEEIDAEACRSAGGTIGQDGLLGLYRCTIPYADAGKTCRDSSECLGTCRGKDGVTDYEADPGAATGVCQANDSPFGCYSTIEDGTPTQFICVD